ncbi:hypothetical protein F4825DRAFT_441393 [Nemania diffusa]|nr:hypothetical protein F4825DRAFT_441393 [Nemania diffusa]
MIESMTEHNGRYVLSERLYYGASRRIGEIWAAYVDALREVVDAKLETSRVDSLQCIGISLFSDESPTFGNQPAVNVLVIHHGEGSLFARRIGVGYIYLADWIKADRMFKTIGLE